VRFACWLPSPASRLVLFRPVFLEPGLWGCGLPCLRWAVCSAAPRRHRPKKAILAGADSVGENRAQELSNKYEFFKKNGCHIHFIGQLQTNKVKYIVDKVSLIQSVDRLHLVEELDRRFTQADRVCSMLVQVNIGREPQKGGVLPEELPMLLETVMARSTLQLQGLMCVTPVCTRDEAAGWYEKMRLLYEKMRDAYGKEYFRWLSMGMSADYDVAILQGANMVRVGTAIFGSRPAR